MENGLRWAVRFVHEEAADGVDKATKDNRSVVGDTLEAEHAYEASESSSALDEGEAFKNSKL